MDSRETIVKSGTKQVYIVRYNEGGKYHSRLYVNSGQTATLRTAKHTTLSGAKKWADKVLAN
jgi:hypothetical protein